MISPLNIHPPKNWQDFEILCLKLWGEIWNIPHEIEFNSDNSQGQQGVDIYGPVNNGLHYNGIQCKNKKLNLIDGSPNRITVSDIEQEINKALEFRPTLNKLIIATSLPKDQKIEEYIRVKSSTNVKEGLFSVQVCFWEFFERKIPEFQKVYDWYVKNEGFIRSKSVSVSFNNGSQEKIYYPKFQKNIDKYIKRDLSAELSLRDSTSKNSIQDFDMSAILDFRSSFLSKNMLEWNQYCWIELLIENTGQSVIEDFKIEIEFQGEYIKVGPEIRNFINNQNFQNDVKGYSNSNSHLYIKPFNNKLVQRDSFVTGKFFIQVGPSPGGEINLNWKLLSRDFSDSGILKIIVAPKYHVVSKEHIISSAEEGFEEVTLSLIKRPGMLNFGGPSFYDRDSDYKFE